MHVCIYPSIQSRHAIQTKFIAKAMIQDMKKFLCARALLASVIVAQFSPFTINSLILVLTHMTTLDRVPPSMIL